jgi:hypothetical protein
MDTLSQCLRKNPNGNLSNAEVLTRMEVKGGCKPHVETLQEKLKRNDAFQIEVRIVSTFYKYGKDIKYTDCSNTTPAELATLRLGTYTTAEDVPINKRCSHLTVFNRICTSGSCYLMQHCHTQDYGGPTKECRGHKWSGQEVKKDMCFPMRKLADSPNSWVICIEKKS